ncbi:MAG TPA: hypothetical protein VHA73_01320 [Acidimicrobiales bacterium]|nr:hypothetical protein [Acidimicrobiales bacterium]
MRPDRTGRGVLTAFGVVVALLVSVVPAVLLIVLGQWPIGVGVIAVAVVVGVWRTAQVGVDADDAGITIRHAWSVETIRWKRVERLVEDRRAWLPGVIVPTLRLRGDGQLVPLLGAVCAPGGDTVERLRRLHGRAVVDWRTQPITASPTAALGHPEAPAIG